MTMSGLRGGSGSTHGSDGSSGRSEGEHGGGRSAHGSGGNRVPANVSSEIWDRGRDYALQYPTPFTAALTAGTACVQVGGTGTDGALSPWALCQPWELLPWVGHSRCFACSSSPATCTPPAFPLIYAPTDSGIQHRFRPCAPSERCVFTHCLEIGCKPSDLPRPHCSPTSAALTMLLLPAHIPKLLPITSGPGQGLAAHLRGLLRGAQQDSAPPTRGYSPTAVHRYQYISSTWAVQPHRLRAALLPAPVDHVVCPDAVPKPAAHTRLHLGSGAPPDISHKCGDVLHVAVRLPTAAAAAGGGC